MHGSVDANGGVEKVAREMAKQKKNWNLMSEKNSKRGKKDH